MHISQDLLYTRLKEKFPLDFVFRHPEGLSCDTSILYDPEEKLDNCAVVISEQDYISLALSDTPPKNTVFICIAEGSDLTSLPACSTMRVTTKASKARVQNEVQRIFSLFNAWENALKSILYENGTFWDISDATEVVLYDPYSVQDKDFQYVSYSSLSEPRGLVSEYVNTHNSYPLDYVNSLMANSDYIKNRGKSEPYIRQNTLGDNIDKNLFSNGKYIGRMVICRPQLNEEMFRYYSAIFETLSLYIIKLYERHNGFARNASSLNYLKKFIIDCLHNTPEATVSIEGIMHDLHWQAEDRFVLIQMRATPRRENEMNTKYLITEMAHLWGNCISFEYNNKLIMLVNENSLEPDDHTTFFQSLAIFLRDNLLAASISRGFVDLSKVKTAYTQTEIAFSYGERMMPMHWIFRFDDIVLPYLLDQCSSTFAPEEICSEEILTLKKYDEEKNTELCKTLMTYLACNHNAVATAKKLCIHRTSFLNRLERIHKLTDIDFSSFDKSLYLYLSLALVSREEISLPEDE